MINKVQIPLLIIILILLCLGCNNINTLHPISTNIEEPQVKTQQKSFSIRKMSDLEVIIYENNQDTSSICKNKDNQDVYYTGEYLVVYFYPHRHMQEQENIIKVFIGADGTVLGYMEE